MKAYFAGLVIFSCLIVSGYAVPVDSWPELAKLTASDGVPGDGLGYSICVSGNTVVIGVPGYGSTQGAAYVFERPSGGWKNIHQTAKLTASGGASGDDFGNSVSISGDIILVGAPYARNQGGVAYVFVKPADGWKDMTQTAELIASDGQSGDDLGRTVAISGNTAVASAPQRGGYGGVVYLFVRPKGGWGNISQTAELTASDGGGFWYMGSSVAVDGDTVVAGAPGAYGSEGAVYLYQKPPRGWKNMTQTAKLVAAHGIINDQLGTAVAISRGTVLAGAPRPSEGGHGAAYVFVMPKGGWKDMTQTAKLVPRGAQEFGSSVAIYQSTAVVGMPLATIGSNQYQGAAFVFAEPKSGWKNTAKFDAKLIATDGAEGDMFGTAVSIDGQTIVGGAPGADTYTGYGAVFGNISQSNIFVP